jgi:hypothetical protein
VICFSSRWAQDASRKRMVKNVRFLMIDIILFLEN